MTSTNASVHQPPGNPATNHEDLRIRFELVISGGGETAVNLKTEFNYPYGLAKDCVPTTATNVHDMIQKYYLEPACTKLRSYLADYFDKLCRQEKEAALEKMPRDQGSNTTAHTSKTTDALGIRDEPRLGEPAMGPLGPRPISKPQLPTEEPTPFRVPQAEPNRRAA